MTDPPHQFHRVRPNQIASPPPIFPGRTGPGIALGEGGGKVREVVQLGCGAVRPSSRGGMRRVVQVVLGGFWT